MQIHRVVRDLVTTKRNFWLAAKPLRVYLEVGEKDNGAGRPESTYHNWPMANERMAAVLRVTVRRPFWRSRAVISSSARYFSMMVSSWLERTSTS